LATEQVVVSHEVDRAERPPLRIVPMGASRQSEPTTGRAARL
jgi:hypothetical protein